MHRDEIPLGAELERHRLRHREARLRFGIRMLEARVAEKRRRDHRVPLALHRSLEAFRDELGRVQGRLT